MDDGGSDIVLFRSQSRLKVGELCRFTVSYTPIPENPRTQLWLRINNLEALALRAAYLQGPFSLYVDMRPQSYQESSKVQNEAEQPRYENHLHASGHWCIPLTISGTEKHIWIVDITSEILFTRSASVEYEILIGTSRKSTKHPGMLSADHRASEFKVNVQDTEVLWRLPRPRLDEPLHIVILTHGLMSNVTSDLHYLKESIDAVAARSGENLICRGYTGNVCHTGKGVKWLGRRVARWIVEDLYPAYHPTKLSFVGHSLGGLIQTYAIGYVETLKPGFFSNVHLGSFVTLASPFLGISQENPGYVRFALDFGAVGKTGRDLGLSWGPQKDPLLERLPRDKQVHGILKRFQKRTVYANSVNDGIVPLRTSSLLYLDWQAIGEAELVASRPQAQWLPNFERTASPKMVRRSQTRTTETSRNTDMPLPRKTSLLESGLLLWRPPHPDSQFVADPARRSGAIFHDRLYTEADLPERRFKERIVLPSFHKEKVEISHIEERIARAYHSGMSWRKVLVQLLPEAHNNIVVRRRFSNAYGWPVVRHVAEEHFSMPLENDSTGIYEEITCERRWGLSTESGGSSITTEHGVHHDIMLPN